MLTAACEGLSGCEVSVPAAKAGTLTTRTDANTGTLTLASGHGFTVGNRVDVYWAAGVRYGMAVTGVSGTAVTVDGGGGNDLPSTSTAVAACKPVGVAADVLGTFIGAVFFYAEARGTFVFEDHAAVIVYAEKLPAGAARNYARLATTDEKTNPFYDLRFYHGYASHADTTAARTMRFAAGPLEARWAAAGDPPVLSVPGTQSGTEDTAKAITPLSFTGSVGTVTVALSVTHGTLAVASTSGLTTVSGGNNTGAYTFTASKSNANTAIATITVTPTADYNGAAVLSIVVTDENADADSDSVTINFAAVNDPPVLTCSGGAAAFTEDGGAVTVDGSLTLSDVDSTTMSSATVEILNFKTGDVLAYTNGSGVTGAWNAGTHKMTLTAGTPVATATMRDRLRTVTFNNTSQNPDTTQRNLEFKANDGTAWSAGSTKHVDVTAVNDQPVIITPDNAPTATVNVETGATVVTDLDATDPENNTVTFTITGGADASLFELVTGIGTVQGLAFVDPAVDGDYVVEVTADDGHGGTDVITITAHVAAIAPEITSDGGGATGTKSVAAGTGVAITTVTATGTGPLVFSLGTEHDETGFAIDPDTGAVTAATLAAGSYDVELIVTGPGGSDSQLLTVAASGGAVPAGYLRLVAAITGDEQIFDDGAGPQNFTIQTVDAGIQDLWDSFVGDMGDNTAGDVLVFTTAADVTIATHVHSLGTNLVNTWLYASNCAMNGLYTAGVTNVKPIRIPAADCLKLTLETYTPGTPPSAGAFQYNGTAIYIASDGDVIDTLLGDWAAADVVRVMFTQGGDTQDGTFSGLDIDSIDLAGGIWTIDAGSGRINFNLSPDGLATIFKQTW